MLLREVRYGLNVGLAGFDVFPMFRDSFSYHVGNIHVDYAQKFCRLELTGRGPRALDFQISLTPNMDYEMKVVASSVCKETALQLRTDGSGVLRFSADGSCVVQVACMSG